MKKLITTLSFSFLMAMGLVTSSSATILEGLSIGVSASHGAFYGEGTEDEEVQDVGTDDTTEAGAFTADFQSVFVEYNLGPISLGIDWMNEVETPKNTNIQGATTNTVSGEFENHITAYAILPVTFLGGLYLKAGVIQVDINSVENLGTGGQYGNADTTGITAGLGYDYEAMDGISIRAEITAMQYEDVSATNTGTNPDRLTTDDVATKVTISEMMGARASLSLVKTF
jgi:hypothetical protein